MVDSAKKNLQNPYLYYRKKIVTLRRTKMHAFCFMPGLLCRNLLFVCPLLELPAAVLAGR